MKKVLIDILKKYKINFLQILVLIIIFEITRFWPAKILGDIIDILENNIANDNLIIKKFAILFLCVSIYVISRTGFKYFEKAISNKVHRDLENNVFERFLNLKIKNIEQIKNGELMSYIMRYTRDIRDGINGIYEYAVERGENFSVGQKQLIAFARIFSLNPDIFNLDEATANIDTSTEQLIQKSIDKLSKEKTAIFIAHRLSTIVNVDKILVLKDGRIIEQGKHQELLEQNGYYAKLYNSYYESLK